MSAERIVRRARSLVGVPFRQQGRDAAAALDCVGLILSVFAIPAEAVRRDYGPRGHRPDEVESGLSRYFCRVSASERQPGDVMLCAIRKNQLHLAIHCGGSFIHADSRARRVVETPGEPPWPVRAAFRRGVEHRSS
jgi:cell wall-associated NlpC family hydrolase